MFTNNYIIFRKMMFLRSSYETFKGMTNASVKGYSVHGQGADIGSYMNRGRCQEIPPTYQGYNPFTTENNGNGLFFGSGSTPATKADYKLESPITSGLRITNPYNLVWSDDGNGKHTAIADLIVRNTSEAEINIHEIGIFTPLSQTSSDSVSGCTFNNVLMERTVLDEPVTIAPGESKLVTYKITFNHTV